MVVGVGRQLGHDVLEQYRFRAVALHRKGWLVKDIAEAFGVNRRAVSRWISVFRSGGRRALKSKKAPGPDFKLSGGDIEKILEELKKPATDFGFENALWTCKRVLWLIKRVTRKNLHISNTWRLLTRCGLSNQKPERRALEQSSKDAEHWLHVEWPKIQAHARRWQAITYFQDESGIHLTPLMGKTWGVKGKTPVVRLTGNRGSLCVSSCISPGGRLLFRVEKGRVIAKTFTDFLEKVLQAHPHRKIIIITDKAPPHTAGLVTEFQEKHSKRFAIYYLPPYSPDLNPDEQVWNYLKNNKIKTHTAQTINQLKRLTLNAMHSIQKQPALVKSFFYVLNGQ